MCLFPLHLVTDNARRTLHLTTHSTTHGPTDMLIILPTLMNDLNPISKNQTIVSSLCSKVTHTKTILKVFRYLNVFACMYTWAIMFLINTNEFSHTFLRGSASKTSLDPLGLSFLLHHSTRMRLHQYH